MGLSGRTKFVWVLIGSVSLLGCDDGGPAATNTSYTLTCPAAPTACGPLSDTTCLRPDGGPAGERVIFATNGELSCDGETPAIVVCRATATTEDRQILDFEAVVGDFGIETTIIVTVEGATIQGTCEVTLLEDGVSYGGSLGTCGVEEPSMEQPCQISNLTVGDADGAEIGFDLACRSLISDLTESGFDVDATVEFARCDGI
ncbi:MAG: hypothetical protein AAF500_13110 [Myxococcota bacterium]